ncbi:Crp/Fnr family transcriptional regulator [Acidaminobacter sp. JC074]|uniref:Crp/Fnr family transcriptional regulator n=1 Tax=Acidaminobacter sp. JC074 TaxID=2530199 RepID=UPI001F0FD5B3|nr:Crp/Fnr family transcriptional regulator [Acidaminobacter sp. JC074]MCH4886168.1 Crp/Fnr family transcriptional regulator [Acidaminobacter sp. JC074]
MYEQLFNEELQKKMTKCFLNVLAPLGSKKTFKKNEIVDPESADQVYIVVEGAFDQVLYSEDGDEITFFRLDKGTIFGEMDFFDGYRTCVITRAAEKSSISIVSRDKIEDLLKEQPELYKEFMHSIIRKYRIVMLELADMRFNNSLGKLAHAILRWSHTTNYRTDDDKQKKTIQMRLTHEELASRLASNRSTITNGLKFFRDKGFIKIEERRITVIDEAGLKDYINPYWADC